MRRPKRSPRVATLCVLGKRAMKASASPIRSRLLTHAAETIATTRSEEHTSELQSLMRISYAVLCLKNKKDTNTHHTSCIKNHKQDSCQDQSNHYNYKRTRITKYKIICSQTNMSSIPTNLTQYINL